jgi:hypothetical protein
MTGAGSKTPDAGAGKYRLAGTVLVGLKRPDLRINNQWRICFVRRDGAANDVEMVDYH